MKKELELSSYIEEIYKNYALYVLESRSIPDWTGLKRSQVKILWVANKHCRKTMKTMSAVGSIVLWGGYHHSPDALADTVAKMAQDFCGSNNMPLILGNGSFGCQTIPDGIAAPRYTEIQIHPNFDVIFPGDDFDIAPASPDPENPEPLFLLPIVPISLLNGMQGIAIGYANKIFPRNVNSLINEIKNILKGKKVNSESFIPYYNNFRGEIKDIGNGKFSITGHIQKFGKNVILIDEIPFKYDILSYKEFLYKLKDDGKIISFIDESDSKWHIKVKVSDTTYNMPEEELIQLFDLKQNLNENITIVSRDGNIKVFETAEDYLRYFVENRLPFYEIRRNHLLNENALRILHYKIKHDIITSLSTTNRTRKDLFDLINSKFDEYALYFKDLKYDLEKGSFEQDIKNIIESIKLVDSLEDKLSENNKYIDSLVKERQDLLNQTSIDMYIVDLKKLEKYVKNP